MMDVSRLATGSVDPEFNTATMEMGTVPNMSIGKNSVSKGDGKFSALKPGEISASLESAPTVAMACYKTDSLAS